MTESHYGEQRAFFEADRMQRKVDEGQAPTYRDAEQQVERENQGGELLRDRLRERTAEDIESFDINTDGLAAHGTSLDNLESVLSSGLGDIDVEGVRNPGEGVWFNLIGAPVKSYKREGPALAIVGFGPDRQLYGGQVVIVTDIFKQLFPNMINAAIKLRQRVGSAVGGELWVNHKSSIDMGMFWDTVDTRSLEEIPEPQTPLVAAMGGEEKEVRSDGRITYERIGPSTPDGYRQMLSPQAFSAIVIRNGTENEAFNVSPQEVLRHIIDTQDKLYPKNEQIPVYDETGRCIYNPLKVS